eukprot:TRINITY_DN11468_c0_g1_i1.p1 TRINITY_DN11468_c0_g1~~TRINITY_DN11468_c0_g1_i1.p1  ORF type:complete len:108 (+),score=15.62 TRINITY_DN11468_c0_g1_i1:155-478(+)
MATDHSLEYTVPSQNFSLRYENNQLILFAKGSPTVLGAIGDDFLTVLEKLQPWCNGDEGYHVYSIFQASHKFGVGPPAGRTDGAIFTMRHDLILDAFENLRMFEIFL